MEGFVTGVAVTIIGIAILWGVASCGIKIGKDTVQKEAVFYGFAEYQGGNSELFIWKNKKETPKENKP